MKKFSIIALIAILGFFTWNCSQQVEVTEPENEFTEVKIPAQLKSTLKVASDVDIEEINIKVTTLEGKEVSGKMRLTIPIGEEEKLANFEITSNIFQETALTPNFFIDNYNSSLKNTAGIGACLKDCKLAGNPKGCKGGCWVELALEVLATAAAVVGAVAAVS